MAKKKPHPAGHQNAIAAAAQALNDATVALGEALRSASSQAAANAVEAATAALEGNVVAATTAATRGVENAATKISARSERRRVTRADLLDSAVTVFAERGYEGTSVEDVAAHAGYTKGAVYSHFTSKADLFLAIFAESDSLSGDALAAAGMHPRSPGHDPDEHDELSVDPCIVLTHELMLFGLRNPEHRQAAAEHLSRTLQETTDAILVANQTHSLGLGTDPAGVPRTDPSPEQRRSVLDALVTASALRHTVSLLHTVGVPELDTATARRILDERAS